MANAYHTADLLKLTLTKSGEKSDGSSRLHALALSYINQVYHSILSGSNEFDVDIGEPWVWARETNPRSLVLEPAYEDGFVSINEDSINGTFSIPPTFSTVGRFLKITNDPTYYQIRTHTAAAAAFTVDQNYVAADVVNGEFKVIRTQYDLGSGIERLVEPFRVYTQSTGSQDFGTGTVLVEDSEDKIYGIDVNAFRKRYPKRFLYRGIATRFTTIRRDQDSWIVEFNAYANKKTKVDFDVIAIQDDLIDSTDSIPLIPREMRLVLVYLAAHFVSVDKEENEKATYFFNIGKAKLKSMVEAEDRDEYLTGKNKGKILPRQEEVPLRRSFGFLR